MGKEYLIDSNAIIDFCNGKLPDGGRNLLFSIEQPVISIITHIEVLGFSNIDETEEDKLRDFVSISRILSLNTQVALKAIEIKRNIRIKLPDAVIAATALISGLKLITRNISDFKDIDGLELINPWEV
jgi:predicted nucleic acid-binding protein